MAIICPTILAENREDYLEQLERVQSFAPRIHIDLADGVFAPTKLIDLSQLSWPHNLQVDLHVMYKTVFPFLDQIIALRPNLVIIHAESVGVFREAAERLKQHRIRVGVALLAQTPVKKIVPALDEIDHVLIFSGDLGHFGGHAQLDLLQKVEEIRRHRKFVEIGWDGGVNLHNAAKLAQAGINVLNSGGAIQSATNPANAYAKLEEVIEAIR